MSLYVGFLLMILRPPISTRTDSLFPSSSLFRSLLRPLAAPGTSTSPPGSRLGSFRLGGLRHAWPRAAGVPTRWPSDGRPPQPPGKAVDGRTLCLGPLHCDHAGRGGRHHRRRRRVVAPGRGHRRWQDRSPPHRALGSGGRDDGALRPGQRPAHPAAVVDLRAVVPDRVDPTPAVARRGCARGADPAFRPRPPDAPGRPAPPPPPYRP